MNNQSLTRQGRRRERRGVSHTIGRWPDDIRFEDADVPAEPCFKGTDRDASDMPLESGLVVGRIVGSR